MNTRLAILAITSTLATTPLFAQTATTLPANVQADIATVKQDAANLKAAASQLRTSEEASSPSIAADRTAVAMARVQLKMDAGKLHADAMPIVQADQAALFSALAQLHTDQVANNAAAAAADQPAVHAAELQLESDMHAIGAGMEMRHGRRWHG